jgi:CRP-like cAMP-binding protein
MLEFTPELVNFLRQSYLFNGVSDQQIMHLLPLMKEVSVKAGTCLMQENTVSDALYLIKEGEATISKVDPVTGKPFHLSTLRAGDAIGELALLTNNVPRSASIHATQDCVLYLFSITELHKLAVEETAFVNIVDKLTELAQAAKVAVTEQSSYSLLLQNLGRHLSQRVRTANATILEDSRKELAHMQARTVMGIIIITVISIMSLYALALELLSRTQLFTPTLLSTPLIAIFSLLVLVAIKKTHYPLSYFGLTLKNWHRCAFEGIIFTIPILILVALYKWILIHTSPGFAGHQVFEFNLSAEKFNRPYWTMLAMLVVYVLLVPLQELMVRGALQGPLQELLISPRKNLWAILLSNLIFSTTHFHISLGIGLMVYLPGLFWGWLYARHKSLVGVTLSHQLLGVWALFVVGFF